MNPKLLNDTVAMELGGYFDSIDDPKSEWPPFQLAMLRIGRILTIKDMERREIKAEYISKLMKKHRKEMPWVYTGKEIRENFQPLSFITGGGIIIEGSELPFPYRGAPHYHFTITKLIRPEPPQNQAPDRHQPINL